MLCSDGPEVHEIDISLPERYGTSPTLSTVESYLSDVSSLLDGPFPRALVGLHLNTAAGDISGADPSGLEDLWAWTWTLGAGLKGPELEQKREEVLKKLTKNELDEGPPILLTLLSSLSFLALPRQPPKDHPRTTPLKPQRVHNRDVKQSAKKIHEVAKLSSLIGTLAAETGTTRVVDVGAGQGYLSRSLSKPPWNLDVLALDGADSQTSGAEAILFKTTFPFPSPSPSPSDPIVASPSGSLIHLTTHIASPAHLVSSTSSWVDSSTPAAPASDASSLQPVSVLLTGLHACGSLTLAILETFILLYNQPQSTADPSPSWKPSSLAVVGCCYNLLTPPHTSPTTTRLTPLARRIIPDDLLKIDSLQLAAQNPSLWVDYTTGDWRGDSRTGLRKMVWRALVEREIARRPDLSGLGELRVGKVGARVWKGEGDWRGYLELVGKKVGVDLLSVGVEMESEREERKMMEFKLGVLHVCRCMLGPAIETLLLLDRFLLLLLSLPPPSPTSPRLRIALKPLFDQSTGSLRNMALIVTPLVIPSSSTSD